MRGLYYENSEFFNFYTNGTDFTYTFLTELTDIEDEDNLFTLTKDFALNSYPNPFNPSTTISFILPENSLVELNIYDMSGSKVKTIINSQIEKGKHSFAWNGDNSLEELVSSGVYFYRLSINNGEKITSKRFMLLK